MGHGLWLWLKKVLLPSGMLLSLSVESPQLFHWGTPNVIGTWQSLWAKRDLLIHTTVFVLLTLKTKETNRIISYDQQQSQAIELPLVIPASTLITCG